MTNGTPTPPEIKIKPSWEERIIATFFAWRQKFFPHPSDQRWGPDKKEIVIKTIKTLMRLLPALFLIGLTLGFLGTKACYLNDERVTIKAMAVDELTSMRRN